MGNKLSREEQYLKEAQYVINNNYKSSKNKYHINSPNYYMALINNGQYDEATQMLDLIIWWYDLSYQFHIFNTQPKYTIISLIIWVHMSKILPDEHFKNQLKRIISYQHKQITLNGFCILSESLIQYCSTINFYDIVDYELEYYTYTKKTIDTEPIIEWIQFDNIVMLLYYFSEHKLSLEKIKTYVTTFWNERVLTSSELKLSQSAIKILLNGEYKELEDYIYDVYQFMFIECNLPLEYNEISLTSGGNIIDYDMHFRQRNMLIKIYKMNRSENKKVKNMFISTECVLCLNTSYKLVMTSCGHAVLCECCFDKRKKYRKCNYCNKHINVDDEDISYVSLIN